MRLPMNEHEPMSWLANRLIEALVAAGATTGGALIGGPPGAIAGAAAIPLLAGSVQKAIVAVQSRWRENTNAAVAHAAEAAGLGEDEVVRRLLMSSTGQELLYSAFTAAAHATTANKIAALGQALATGALATDPADMDPERRFVEAMADLDVPHIRLLKHVVQSEDDVDNPTATSSQELSSLPWTGSDVFSLLGSLQRHGAIYAIGVGFLLRDPIPNHAHPIWEQRAAPGQWIATPFGRECLRRLREVGIHESEVQPATVDLQADASGNHHY
jgi:hypothetical protein